MTFWLHKFRQLDMTQEKHRQMLIDTFVNAIFVYDDKLLLTFNFKDGQRTITLADTESIADESGSNLVCSGVPKKRGHLVVSSLFCSQRDSKGRPDRREGTKQSGGLFYRPWESP